MSEKWSNIIKENLESGDEKPYFWDGRLDKKNGHIVLLKKKMLFIEEHGFLSKTALTLSARGSGEVGNCSYHMG